MFNRNLEKEIEPFLDDPQAKFILGPRRSGKTTLLKLLEQSILDNPIHYYDPERISDREALSKKGLSNKINKTTKNN